MLVLDRASITVDQLDVTLNLADVRTLVLARCKTTEQARELRSRLADPDALEVRERHMKVNVRHELVVVLAGQDVVLAEFGSPTDAALWTLVLDQPEPVAPVVTTFTQETGIVGAVAHREMLPLDPRLSA